MKQYNKVLYLFKEKPSGAATQTDGYNFIIMKHKNNDFQGSPHNQNFNPSHFLGQYTHAGGAYFQNTSTGILVKICTREVSTIIKPKLYMVQRTETGQFPYITSLYPMQEPNTFKAEIQRQYFRVIYKDDTLNVLPAK